MARRRRRIHVTFPLPSPRYDPQNESVFRDDLERLLIEVASLAAEEAIGGEVVEFTDDDATPSVAGRTLFSESYANATDVTAFDDGVEGQTITILFTTGNFTLKDGANMHLSGGSDFTGSADDTITLIFDGTSWFEVSRSVN